MSTSKILSVIVCFYYNEESIPELFREICILEKKLLDYQVGVELVFVNDGSGDNSLRELLKVKQQRKATKVISLARNFGSVAALKVGFGYVTGDACVLLAADLQDPPEQVVPMVEKWLQGHKFVVSARASRQDPLATRFYSRIYYWILKWLVIRGYPRGGYDLMLIDKAMLPYMINSTKHTNPNLYAFWLGFKPSVLLYHRKARRHGKSRWTFAKKLNFFVDTITGFSVLPIRLLSLVGIVTALLSFLYGSYIAVFALLGYMEVPGFATLVVLMSFFSGLILIMLGVIGEYLWRVLEAVNNRPEAIVDEVFL